jgi:hypothetical protein
LPTGYSFKNFLGIRILKGFCDVCLQSGGLSRYEFSQSEKLAKFSIEKLAKILLHIRDDETYHNNPEIWGKK